MGPDKRNEDLDGSNQGNGNDGHHENGATVKRSAASSRAGAANSTTKGSRDGTSQTVLSRGLSLRAILFGSTAAVVISLILVMLQFDSATHLPRANHFVTRDEIESPVEQQQQDNVATENPQVPNSGDSSSYLRKEENTENPGVAGETKTTEVEPKNQGTQTSPNRPIEAQVEMKFPKETHSNAKLLVTGAASFVGYHTITALDGARRKHLIAVDDFDASLDDDVEMKRYRALRLQQKYSVDVEQADICNAEKVEQLLKKGVTHVLHFHDPIDPPISSETILKRDLEHRRKCHETLFGVIKKLTKGHSHSIPVIYISSSTIYANAKETGSKASLVNDTMVALNKFAQEEVARVHYKYDGMPSLGLRLFSVYGPLCSSSSPLKRIGEGLMYGNGDKQVHLSSTDFIFVKDLAKSVLSLLSLFDTKELSKISPELAVDVGSGMAQEVSEIHNSLKSSISNTAVDELKSISVFDKTKAADVTILQKVEGKQLNPTPYSEGVKEFAEWFKCFFFPKGYVLTTYLVSEKDPQRRTAYSTDGKFDLIRAYYDSAHEADVQSYIFHDGLSARFIHQYETPRFKFIDVHTLYSGNEESEVTNYVSNNDRRFFYFDRFMAQLKRNRAPLTLPTYIMSSDLFDVKMLKNPFDFFDQKDPKSLFVGSETNRFRNNWWMNDRFRKCRFSEEIRRMFVIPENKYLLNAGLIAGRWDVMQEFLNVILDLFPKFNPKSNCNMPLVNYIGYKYFPDRLVTGRPFHSIYKLYNKDKHDVYVVHK
eukprot:gb/GECG01010208.1/.p1 GENE.gb/GECG01010208.1/~~gb/GECG01010208.1/.p1  ORF type:complete len:767 (+),score=102.06 gb/GECG01010208.1/:1-2301(+)